MPDVTGRQRSPKKLLRSNRIYVMVSRGEYEQISAAAAARQEGLAEYMRLAAIARMIAPTSAPKGKGTKPGGQAWLWTQLRKDLDIWFQTDGPQDRAFAPLANVKPLVEQITSTSKLSADEARDLIQTFLHRQADKIAKLTGQTKRRWERANMGRLVDVMTEDEDAKAFDRMIASNDTPTDLEDLED